MIKDEIFIRRCFDLARLGASTTSPNPMVGAVLVYQNTIIGEGYHQIYGGAHAEVNAVNSVPSKFQHLIAKSTLYVSLEPCCIFGRTPPCTNLILDQHIPRVIISCLDQTPNVNGRAVQLLREAGVEVHTKILESEGKILSQNRQTFVSKKRPYIILKYAQTSDGFIGRKEKQVWISNELSKRWVHKWRSEVDAILIGTNTAIIDNPQLTNRLYFGKSPIRVLLDRRNAVPKSHRIFDSKAKTWVITENSLTALVEQLYKKRIMSLMVEGGAQLFKSFISKNLWDEARVFEAEHTLGTGVKAPKLPQRPIHTSQLFDNTLKFYRNNPSQ